MATEADLIREMRATLDACKGLSEQQKQTLDLNREIIALLRNNVSRLTKENRVLREEGDLNKQFVDIAESFLGSTMLNVDSVKDLVTADLFVGVTRTNIIRYANYVAKVLEETSQRKEMIEKLLKQVRESAGKDVVDGE